MSLKLKAAFLLGPMLLLGTMPQHADDASAGKDTHFKRIAMEYLFYELINRGAHVAYVQIPLKPSDAITARDKIKQLQAIPEGDRTKSEQEQLKRIPDDLARKLYTETTVCDWHQTTYEMTMPERLDDPKIARETVQALAALEPRYDLLQFDSLFVLCPKDDPIKSKRVTLILKDVPATEAIGKLDEVLKAQGIDHMEVMAMPTRSDGKGEYGDTKITLNVVNVPVVELISRFALALGPAYTWDMMTIEGNGRHFGFTRVSPPPQN